MRPMRSGYIDHFFSAFREHSVLFSSSSGAAAAEQQPDQLAASTAAAAAASAAAAAAATATAAIQLTSPPPARSSLVRVLIDADAGHSPFFLRPAAHRTRLPADPHRNSHFGGGLETQVAGDELAI